MRQAAHRALRLLLLCSAALFLFGMAAAQAAGEPATSPLRVVAAFEEPLVASRAPSAADRAALHRALEAFERSPRGDLASLRAYADEQSHSPWRLSWLLNLGLLEYQQGYFSRALSTWQAAWSTGRDERAPLLAAQADRAFGELVRMHARLGLTESLERLLGEVEGRTVTGASTEMVTGAREGLWVMHNEPGVAFLCGPAALRNVLATVAPDAHHDARLAAYRSGRRGVSLAEIERLAAQVGLAWRAAERPPGAAVPVPSIVHWKVNHYAAIVGQSDGLYHIKDPTFGDDLWITQDALDAESSGRFLVPAEVAAAGNWRTVGRAEAERTYGMGSTSAVDADSTTPDDITIGPGACESTGCATYAVHAMTVSLSIIDTPVAYRPGFGPAVGFTVRYNHREARQPAVFGYSNLGPKWTHDWLAYIQDNPGAPSANVVRVVGGGGAYTHSGYSAGTGQYAPETRNGAVLARTSASPVRYELREPDGSRLVFESSDGATGSVRRVFLTRKVDPQGNAVTLGYDAQQRLVTLTDAAGRVSQIGYGSPASLRIASFTDPAGRSAGFDYDASGRLVRIVDAVGLVSTFAYSGSTDLVSAMTTPYGTTSFTVGNSTANGGPWRWLQATDPRGETERVEYRHAAPGIAGSEPEAPTGMSLVNQYIQFRNTFHWDKHAWRQHPGDYTRARLWHWLHRSGGGSVTARVLESTKEPLERRVWFQHTGASPAFTGTFDRPIRIGRVHPNGSTQLVQRSYNAQGNLTREVDPAGRETLYDYAADGIDLIAVRQRVAPGSYAVIAQYSYNAQRRPVSITDAAGRSTHYTYNAAGQPLSTTNALGQTTQFVYDALGYLSQVINPLGQVHASYTHDAAGNLASHTDAGGHTVTMLHDGLNRLVRTTWPNGSSEQHGYTALDRSHFTDRLGRSTVFSHNAVRELVAVTEPLGGGATRTVQLGRYPNGALHTLTDANGRVTTWERDIQGRVTRKVDAAGAADTYTYDPSGRLAGRSDPLGQLTTWQHTVDDRLAGITYANAVHPTANVSITWDPYFPRPAGMSDGAGSTSYAYHPPGVDGALQLAQQSGPWPGQGYTQAYDALGRVAQRSVWAGSDSATSSWSRDALGRVVASSQGELGGFMHHYLGNTDQRVRTKQAGAPGWLQTEYSYAGNLQDRRLTGIHLDSYYQARSGEQGYAFDDAGRLQQQSLAVPGAAQAAVWQHGHDAADRLTGRSVLVGGVPQGHNSYQRDAADNLLQAQRSGGPVGLDAPGGWSVDALNRVVGWTYDANGNLLSDGQRQYRWDAERRLVGIVHGDGSQSHWVHDGLGKRAWQQEPEGQRRNLWCGEQLCQVTDASDTVMHRYYEEGERVGSQAYLVGRDHLGSVVREFEATTGALRAEHWYSANGQRVSDCKPPGCPGVSQGWAGQYRHERTGLQLATYRVYDPGSARWLSRDPIGEAGGINLYAYVGGSPVSRIDPLGLYTEVIVWNGVGVGSSAFGHVSTNINGVNYSFAPGGWDRTYPSASAYAARQQSFRSGSGTVLGLSPAQEAALAQCLNSSGGAYSSTSNNCGTSIQSCLAKVGVNVGNSMLPFDLSQSLSRAPAAIGQTYYPGPSQFAPMPVVP